MSSKKKKSSTTRCDFCHNYFLTADFEKHSGIPLSPHGIKGSPISSKITPKDLVLTKCSQNNKNMLDVLFDWDNTENFVQYLSPRIGMFAVVHNLERLNQLSAETLIGWEKQNFALIHPETMAQLEISPRMPAIIINKFEKKIVTLWPSNEIPQLRINFVCKKLSTNKYVKVLIVNQESIKDLSLLRLNLITPLSHEYLQNLREDKSLHLLYYLKSYLSQAFISSKLTLTVNFYSKLLEFSIQYFETIEPIENILKELKISKKTNPANESNEFELYKFGIRTELDVIFDKEFEEDEDDLR